MEVLIQRTAVVVLLLAGSACEFVRTPTTIDPGRNQLLVHSVLSAGNDTVRVLLTRPAQRPSAGPPVFVTGAQVRIAGAGAAVLLREAPEGFAPCLTSQPGWDSSPPTVAAGPGCYVAVVPGGVQVGARYTLEVNLPGGEQATGETTVPAFPEWIGPTEAERIGMRWTQHLAESEPVLLHWRSSAAALEIQVSAAEEVQVGGQAVDAHCAPYMIKPDGSLAGTIGSMVEGDSLRVRVHLSNCSLRRDSTGSAPSVRPDRVVASLLLAAYDSAYATHVHRGRGGGLPEEHASPGLRGAYGVFGSVATARRRVVFDIEGS